MNSLIGKRKRAAPAQQPTTAAQQSSVIHNLLDGYDFLATNEYSEKTIGIQAFLTRKSVGDVNYSDIIDDSEKRNRPGQQINFAGILEDKRDTLPEIDASIEKCLMLTRLIDYIRSHEGQFAKLISDIRLDMQLRMTDETMPANSYDFARREQEFQARKTAQERRRLFYHSDAELQQPKNLVYLQNRTTEHLQSLIARIPSASKNRQSLQVEFDVAFRNSFMIVAQPHSGVNPVIIYERKSPGEYTAKVSVMIICLLYDFMQLNPNVIELYDIEPSLCPSSEFYKLEEPRSISWKTCQLQTGAGGRYRTFLCAELSSITIEQSSKSDTRVRFAQLLHSLKFAIKLQLNTADSKMPPVFQFPLESMVFGIGAHNNQTSQLLTRVIFEDVKKFSQNPLPSTEVLLKYLQRYFIHRTGVEPKDCVSCYIDQELNKAKNRKSNFQAIEDIYLDFVVNFVYQVEFMAKHPILAMFHADGLFLGICNSERAAEAIVQSWASGSPVIGLRFNSIRIDYESNAAVAAVGRTVKCPHCAIRVDIYNDKAKNIQNRTFDSNMLVTDISRFVCNAEKENGSRIRILSSFNDRTNNRSYLPLNTFAKYYHKRLHKLVKDDEKYKPVTDLVENANDGNTEEDGSEPNEQPLSNFSLNSSNSNVPWSPIPGSMNDFDSSRGPLSVQSNALPDYRSPDPSIPSPQPVLSPTMRQQPPQISQMNQEDILKQFLSRPDVAEQLRQLYGGQNLSAPPQPSPPMPPQVDTQYAAASFFSPQPAVMQHPQMPYQQPPFAPSHYVQQSPVQFPHMTMVPQHMPAQYPQQTAQYVLSPGQQPPPMSTIIHYHPQHVQQAQASFVNQHEDTDSITELFTNGVQISPYLETQPNGLTVQQSGVYGADQTYTNDPKFKEILQHLKQ